MNQGKHTGGNPSSSRRSPSLDVMVELQLLLAYEDFKSPLRINFQGSRRRRSESRVRAPVRARNSGSFQTARFFPGYGRLRSLSAF